MLQLAYMRCADKELAEDLVQEACLKAYKSYMSKDFEITSPKSWLFKILVNTHIDHTRKKQFNTIDASEIDIPSRDITSGSVETNIFLGDLSNALKELEQEQRMVVYLADVKEFSYKEISEILDIPLGTVMSRLYRARQTLRKLLKEKGYSRGKTKAEKS
ncbi:MAG: sigma-70 family RNA polymerase sigma factor [Candidatus Melainabacteria bacterium]|nr:sigma-70 family RNA polymerase sigma factor [Candidatus Melainabacteria bacterium]